MKKLLPLLFCHFFYLLVQGQPPLLTKKKLPAGTPSAKPLSPPWEQAYPGIQTFLEHLSQELPAADIIAETPVVYTCSTCMFCKDCEKPGYAGINPFNPYSGNVHREVRDLEVWGGVGDEQLVWMRYGNSYPTSITRDYGQGHAWNSSYKYTLLEKQRNSQGQTPMVLFSPEGSDDLFLNNTILPNVWVAQGPVSKRIIQYGTNYYLQNEKGFRYRFEKIYPAAGPPYFQLQDFVDSHQNLYTLTYNANRKLTRVTEPAGRYLRIDYQTLNGEEVIAQVSTRDGRSVVYNYSDTVISGFHLQTRLTSVQYGDGTKARYIYNSFLDNACEHVIDPRYEGAATNVRYTYSPVNSGVVYQEKNGVTGEVMVTFNLSAPLSLFKQVCYPNGRRQNYEINPSQYGNVNSFSNAFGSTERYSYANSGTGYRLSMTDALLRTTKYDTVTDYGNRRMITYPDGKKEKWTRDTLDLVLTHTDEEGNVTTYKRDSKHRVEQIDYVDRSYETFTYNEYGQVQDHRLRNEGTEHYSYDSRGLKTRFTDAMGNVTKYTYDDADRLNSIIDARNDTTSYVYNERGLVMRETNADHTFKLYEYDSVGNRTKVTDELNHTWTTLYDEFRRPKTITDPRNRTTTYSYDLPGGVCGCTHEENKPTRITLPSGKITEIEYDLEWRKIRETVSKGSADEATTLFEYDVAGNMVRMIDPAGKAWAYEYDARNRMKNSTDPLGNKTQWFYDGIGRVLKTIRPDNGVTSNVYNDINRTTQTTNSKNQLTVIEYDTKGNMVKLTDAKNNTYAFEYDLDYRRTKRIYPNASFEAYTYDPVSSVKTYTNRAGQTRTYIYDNRNRELNSSWNDNLTPSISKSYFDNGLIKTISSNISTLNYLYNVANELISETQNIIGAGGAKTVGYDYNSDGLRNTVTYPGGNVVSYNYTGRNQVMSIKDGATALVTYTYDVNDNRISKVMSNGVISAYTYDSDNRILSIDNLKSNISFGRFDYGYDSTSRKKFVQRDNGKGDVYTYDAIDQITDVKYEVANPDGTAGISSRTASYSIDEVGNRIGVTDNGITANYASNNLNQYTQIGSNPLTYTANGNLQTYDGWIYTYDAQDRLVKAEKGSSVTTFSYDARNRCVKRIVNGAAIFLYYDGWSSIEEYNASNTLSAKYIWGLHTDEVLSRTAPTGTVYYHHDALGSVTHLTDVSGIVVEKYLYDIYGAVNIKSAGGNTLISSAYGNRFMYTGREFIQETGLYDYRNRMYIATLGRFIQTDPKRFNADDVNYYRYVENNTVNKVDPFGLDCLEDFNKCQGNVNDNYKKLEEELGKTSNKLKEYVENAEEYYKRKADELTGPSWTSENKTSKYAIEKAAGLPKKAIDIAYFTLMGANISFNGTGLSNCIQRYKLCLCLENTKKTGNIPLTGYPDVLYSNPYDPLHTGMGFFGFMR